MDPWASVVPSAVTSVITTLITLTATFGVAKLRGRSDRNAFPVSVRRSAASGGWVISNRTKRFLSDVSINVHTTDNKWRQIVEYGPFTSLYPQSERHVGDLNVGEGVTMRWTELKRNKPARYRSIEFRVKEGEEEYMPRATTSKASPAKGGPGGK
ncbi:hypothetical protein JVX92_00665 [Microbacterium hominis]|uniref:hypothetical protein n=1 Tax=Microbacterium hominis TaxID=162426 RepID=UPI00196531CB|nr:hypothetical protein [Microbacterium hominis]QRY40840.1 hypothetical protein JVX92_00665 [Microbacterium hominis]